MGRRISLVEFTALEVLFPDWPVVSRWASQWGDCLLEKMSVSKSPLLTPKTWRPLTVNHHLKVLLLSYIALVTKPLIHVALCNTSGLYRRYKMTYRERHYENMANTVLQVNVLQSIAWKPQTRERHWGTFRGILNAWEPSETTVRNIDQVWLSAPKSPMCVCVQEKDEHCSSSRQK